MKSEAKVSVVTVTYLQQDFILDTIKGVFAQQYNDQIDYIIVNDNSPDSTDEVISNFLDNFNVPLNINVIYIKNDENKGAIANFIWSLQQSKGKYIAICEGDDYWTDSNKLQKQIDFLDTNEDFSICFHAVEELSYSNHNNSILPYVNQEKEYTIEDLAKQNLIHTPSVVYRNTFSELPSWLSNSPAGDYPLFMIHAANGKIKYLPERMAVYRVGSGMCSTLNKIELYNKSLVTLHFLLSHFKSNDIVKKLLQNQYEEVLTNLIALKSEDMTYVKERISLSILLSFFKNKLRGYISY